MTKASPWLRAGMVGRPHGLDGSFHVVGPSQELLQVGRRLRLGDAERTIERRAGTEQRVILRIDGCADRASAEALRGTELLIARDEAPPLEEDEWWAEDLEGCSVRDGERPVGQVRRLLALPSCEVLEVERDGKDLLIPLIADAVRTVDLERRIIDVDLAFLGEA